MEEVETWFQLERVSIVNCDMDCLPELQFECPSLLSLNIQHNQRLENLPKFFLRQMSNLTYLNLSSTKIHELPNEIITHLFNLEFLDISRTKIKSLPHELGNLKKLKYLFCGYLFLGKLQAGLLSNLYSLQVLDLYPYGYVEPKELEILRSFKGIGMCASTNEILQQFSHLPIVNINIQEIEGLLTLQLSSLTSEVHGWPKDLQIISCTTIQNIVITNRTKINLKFLRLFDLPKLRSFIWRIEPKEVFPMLQLVQIEACHSLTSLHWVLHLPLLYVLVLKNCDAIEELIDEEVGEIEEDKAITTFPRLKYLTIVHLPKLVKISSCVLDFPHLPKVHLEDCPNLKRLPFKPDIINNQGLLIKCEKKWWEILEWDDATIQSQFCSNSTEEEEITEFFGSKDIQLKELRKKNAKGLQLEPFAGKEDIFNVLKSSNFVLLLDNIWEEMCATMGAEEMIIKVECLEPDEAWDLFKDNVNLNVIESNENFKKIAWQVMRKCGGLPLALKVVGKAMSNKKSVQD
ncbi:probable disease resistance protein At1g61310 [Dioscorea cayenensis subsp. rotundata]|uniref:Probable disease resistance protein At1g61310 n=1 Tax=Dioscorea cayennensis subsp. rotundata TaxID=55577 RepID=A0AB40CEB8_DIOCR|nr:probable disease resistance protein At1g61310 [Dioscorea cayenensis subsp. rotundata]